MAANTDPIFPKIPSLGLPKTFTSADTTTKKTIASGDTDGTRIDSIWCTSDDTALINLMFYLGISGTDYHIGNVPITISAGYLAVPKIDAMPYLSGILGFLVLPSGVDLKCACLA